MYLRVGGRRDVINKGWFYEYTASIIIIYHSPESTMFQSCVLTRVAALQRGHIDCQQVQLILACSRHC